MTSEASAHTGPQSEPSTPIREGKERRGSFTILVPLDGSERAARALPIAEDILQRLAGEITLIRVLPVTPLPYAIPVDYIPPDVYQQMVNDQERLARDYLEHAAAEIRQRGMRAGTHLTGGDPTLAIMDELAAVRPSMVVMTTHGRTGLARFALGSVADRVVRGGGVPVLLVRAFPEGAPPKAPRRALVPLDGSPLAEAALFTVGLQLAGAVLREITLAHAVDWREGAAGVRRAEEYLDQTRRRFVERLEGRECAVTTRVEVGEPAARLLAVGHEREADLILMATHSEAGLGRLAFGCVTDRLLRDGDTPILLVCPPKVAAGDQAGSSRP